MKNTVLISNLLIILFVFNTNAQIVYTDINPDNGVPTGGGFDFNGDGVNEIVCTSPFYMTYPAGSDIWANGLPPGQGTGWDVPKPLVFNTIIDNNGNFLSQPTYGGDCNINGVSTNPFASMVNQDRFLGIKMRFNGQVHFGWIRLVWTGSTYIYKDFAYETAVNAPINAGDKGTSSEINQAIINKINIYPNPVQNSITIENRSEMNILKIQIINFAGKVVKELSTAQHVENTIDISKLPKGVYLVNLFDILKKIHTYKIIKN